MATVEESVGGPGPFWPRPAPSLRTLGEMPWAILLLAAGSLAIPAPSILLVPPYPSSQEDPIHISCTAPATFLGANFTLYRGGHVVQLLQAPAGEAGVTFNVSGSTGIEAPSWQFCCQYGVTGEDSQPQLSDLSQPVQVSFPVPTWILTLSLSLAGACFLLVVLVVFAVVVRKVKVKNLQKRREQESCWVQINYDNTGEEDDIRGRPSGHPGCLPRQRRATQEADLHVLLAGAPGLQHLPGLPVRLRKGRPPFSPLSQAAWRLSGAQVLLVRGEAVPTQPLLSQGIKLGDGGDQRTFLPEVWERGEGVWPGGRPERKEPLRGPPISQDHQRARGGGPCLSSPLLGG
ncbi:protein HIDE1 isoform X2 [Cavia porcellus]|uniref:protein HIDE1 isoform X2 n=1 Tax=Cavia porcellus TaxID=10141 RepID=UPI002FE0CBC8